MIHLAPTAGEIRGRGRWHAAGIRRGVESIIAISPSKCVTCLFYTARGIDHFAARLEEILPKVTLERTVETLERKGRRDFIFSFANELLDELI